MQVSGTSGVAWTTKLWCKLVGNIEHLMTAQFVAIPPAELPGSALPFISRRCANRPEFCVRHAWGGNVRPTFECVFSPFLQSRLNILGSCPTEIQFGHS